MSGISLSTGLISGLDISKLVEAMALSQQRAIDRLTARTDEFEIKKTGINTLEANLLALNSTVTALKNKITFEQLSFTNSGDQQMRLTVSKNAAQGGYVFQALQKATNHQALSRGFSDATTQKIGQGELVVSQGGFLDQATLLESLNDGAGVRRGTIRISDRSGASAIIDLTRAVTVDDVLSQINNSVDISVEARVSDGHFVLEDRSGGTTGNLAVVDLNGGYTASDLGLRQSVANSTLTGDDVFTVTENFLLDQINDGNKMRLLQGGPDMRITLSSGAKLEVNLDGSRTIRDVLEKINSHSGNKGKLEASLENGRLVLKDLTEGAGTLVVEDINQSTVVRQLGLNAATVDDTLTGNRLSAGMNSVLLRNLRGGQGITELGEISLTDRSGQTATMDLSGAETLRDVIEAINNAVDENTGEPLHLRATFNELGNGILVSDTSGQTASNLIIQDLAGSTLAAELNLEIDQAANRVNSGGLSLRYVNDATSLSSYAPDGGSVEEGSFRITDSAGNIGIITVSSATKNVGDVIQRINANNSLQVLARLNSSGDGFELIDQAGGSGTLLVEDLGNTTTAADLRIAGAAKTTDGGGQRIDSRKATVVNIEADDTLDDLVKKLNEAGNMVTASVFNDGSANNPMRLSLTARSTGQAGRLLIDDGGLGLNFGTIVAAQDARLQVGNDPASSFIMSSSTNRFNQVVSGIDVDVLAAGATPANVTVTQNTNSIFERIQQFITGYNQFVDIGNELTKFDPANNQRGILQGDSLVQRVTFRLSSAVTARYSIDPSEMQALSQMGIRIGDGGKLVLDEERLQAALTNDLPAVKQFFTREATGFATRIEETLKSMTDVVDGTFTTERNVLNVSIDRANTRIDTLTSLMESKKTRLLNEFVAMENVIGKMQTQQNALASLMASLQAR